MEGHGSVSSKLSRNRINLGQILSLDVHLGRISHHSLTVGSLGDHRSALANVPVDENGGGSGLVLFGQFHNNRVVMEIDDSLT